MKKKKLLSAVLSCVMLFALMAGCSGSKEPSGSTAPSQSGAQESQDVAEVQYKDSIIFVTSGDQNYMDGQMNSSNEKILRSVYSSLVKMDPDTSKMVGDLAESWETSEDGLTWTFHLRHGVKFHNGKELTAKDVKASYDRLLNKDDPVRYTSTMSIISACEIVDDYTVTLSTETPSAALLPNLLHRANTILDADYIEKYGKDLGLTAESVNGTGPYKLATWNVDELMVLEAFDDYFGGAPATKTINIEIVPEASSRAIALETGAADIADGLNVDDILRLQDTEGFKVDTFEGIGTHLYQFNCANEYVSNVKVRQAIIYAVDMETIVDTLYSAKHETVCDAPLNPNIWGYASQGVAPYDPEKAKELLAEAGYPNGFEMSIMVLPSYDKAIESAELIKDYLAKVGINATIDQVERAVFNDAFKATKKGENFPWGMFIMGQGPGTCDADGMRRYYAYEGETNANNYGWYYNEEVDTLRKEAAAEMDETERKAKYARIQEIVWLEDPAAMWMNNRNNFYCTTDKVEGLKVDARNAIDFTQLRVIAD